MLSVLLLTSPSFGSAEGSEPDLKKARVSPGSDDFDWMSLVEVKKEPTDERRDAGVDLFLLTHEGIKNNLRRINPVDPVLKRKPTANCLLCCVSFLNWVKTGVLTPAPAVTPDKPNILIRPKNAVLLDQDAAKAIPGHAVEIIIEDVQEKTVADLDVIAVVERDGRKIISFDPCAMSDLEKTLADLHLHPVRGGDCASGLMSLGYKPEYMDKVVTEAGITGHFLNFYMYSDASGFRKTYIVDPQTSEITTLANFIKKESKYDLDTVYLWWDSTKKAWAEPISYVKKEPVAAEVPEDILTDADPNPRKRSAEIPLEELQSNDAQKKPAIDDFEENDRILATFAWKDKDNLLGDLDRFLTQAFNLNQQQQSFWVMDMSLKGSIYAQSILSWMYFYGKISGASDYTSAVFYARKSADQGYAPAQCGLGFLYSNGHVDGQVNGVEAFNWYKKAADQGYAPAQCGLGFLYSNGHVDGQVNGVEAFNWYKKSADQGYATAQCNLGRLYANGHVDGHVNGVEAFKWYKKAADQGHVAAQYGLGFLYSNGHVDGQVNWVEAFNWYKKAADQGHATAQYSLGVLYAKGHVDGQVNRVEAFKWCKKAADQNYAVAQDALGDIYANGYLGKKNLEEALKWYNKAYLQQRDLVEQKIIEVRKQMGKIRAYNLLFRNSL